MTVGCLDIRLHQGPMLRFGRRKPILVRDTRVSFQQIAPSKSRPTEADERFLLGV